MEFAEYIAYLFNFSLGVAAVLAFIMIVTAGIKLLESRGNPSEIEDAKKKIINSLIGLTVLLTAYILLTTINPEIINTKNINLGGINISVPVITPTTSTEKVTNYQFEEIPLGTITEGILMGNSSKKNGLPCYEYESDLTKIKDEDGRIIIGDTIDQNEDGIINSEDYLLNKDIFYCIKLLDTAIKNKTEYHLKELINRLDESVQGNCSCSNCYEKWLKNDEPQNACIVSSFIPCSEYNGEDCSDYKPGCPTCNYSCNCCGGYNENGCRAASGWSEENPVGMPCNNKEEIECKRQEIKQLIDGTTPDEYCYKDGHIKWWDEEDDKREDMKQKLLTYQKSMQRMAYFKQYYLDEVASLEKAEAKLKDLRGESLSASELYNNVETKNNVSVTKNTYEGYDISRYCREANCIEYEYDEIKKTYKYDQYGQRVCSKYDFNEKDRVCKTDVDRDCKADDQSCKDAAKKACEEAKDGAEKEACKEYYTYAGDGATFYHSSTYNEDESVKQEIATADKKDNNCDIEEGKTEEGVYGGLIPIGETVDYTEAWGTEVARVIQTMIDEVKSIADEASNIFNFPTLCNCSTNCTQSTPIECCTCPSEGTCPSKDCQDNQCSTCEPREKYKKDNCSEVSEPYNSGCLVCGKDDKYIIKYKSRAKHGSYVCPFGNMCTDVRKIYQIGSINNSCFAASTSEEEEKLKEDERLKIGYLPRFEARERILFSLSGLNISNGSFSKEPSDLFPELDCLHGCDYKDPPRDITCSSTTSQFSLNRFSLFNMLKASREKLTGCVNGFSYPYKESNSIMRLMSCYEAENSSLSILPDFPYPNKANEKSPYINCYPYNSSNLTTTQKEQCFYNINRTGVESNPGCLMITKNYMDNYYCCQ